MPFAAAYVYVMYVGEQTIKLSGVFYQRLLAVVGRKVDGPDALHSHVICSSSEDPPHRALSDRRRRCSLGRAAAVPSDRCILWRPFGGATLQVGIPAQDTWPRKTPPHGQAGRPRTALALHPCNRCTQILPARGSTVVSVVPSRTPSSCPSPRATWSASSTGRAATPRSLARRWTSSMPGRCALPSGTCISGPEAGWRNSYGPWTGPDPPKGYTASSISYARAWPGDKSLPPCSTDSCPRRSGGHATVAEVTGSDLVSHPKPGRRDTWSINDRTRALPPG
jgi:hypothetical protein